MNIVEPDNYTRSHTRVVSSQSNAQVHTAVAIRRASQVEPAVQQRRAAKTAAQMAMLTIIDYCVC
jgi:hypothetical protein